MKTLNNKPFVLKKMLRYRKHIKNGEYALQLLELNYNSACNFRCSHCYAKNISNTNSKRKMTLEDVADLANQADEAGVWQWHLQGGEPLLWSNLGEVLTAVNTKRFYTFITSNGWFLTEDKAKELADLNVDKVSISLDSFDAETHDRFRNKKGAYQRAVQALFNVSNAGMQANINVCITHQNVRSDDVRKILDFALENKFQVLFVIATPTGAWSGQKQLLITEKDAEYILELKKKYNFIHRDLFPLFDFEWGCRAMNGLVYVTPQGDLLACPFIHVKIGNILVTPLKELLKRGWRVKQFRDYNPKCLAGEDHHFIDNYLPQNLLPGELKNIGDVFNKEDMYEE